MTWNFGMALKYVHLYIYIKITTDTYTIQSQLMACMSRSSHQRCSIEIGVLKNFTKFKGKHLRQSVFLNKVAGLKPATLLKKRLWCRCFPANFVKFLRTTFYRTPPDNCFCMFDSLHGHYASIALLLS